MRTKLPKSLSDPDATVDLEELIEEVVPDAPQWKRTPNPLLGGKRPIDLLHTSGEQILRDMLRAAKQGMAS
ncbi:MAG TPA: MbcA/ParS/Xre antitoxin family protein [Tepidisphaeraceae bacterium]|nr:MbcA/ParS/Xre antitoxin family protein [Tepidisphaeraceae bacterium]